MRARARDVQFDVFRVYRQRFTTDAGRVDSSIGRAFTGDDPGRGCDKSGVIAFARRRPSDFGTGITDDARRRRRLFADDDPPSRARVSRAKLSLSSLFHVPTDAGTCWRARKRQNHARIYNGRRSWREGIAG